MTRVRRSKQSLEPDARQFPLEKVRRSVVGMATAFGQVAATAEAAYAEVPAPQITAARFCTME